MFSAKKIDITELAANDLSRFLMDENNITNFGLPTPPLGAFSGVPILGITEHIAGPGALGTLVEDGGIGINIEPPTGDAARNYLSYESYATFNAGKMSMAMNLKEDGNYIKILKQAMIIIDNRSKRARDNDQVLQQFLHDVNKPNRMIYCYISGFPGEEEAKLGNDVVIQAASGMAYVNGSGTESPLKVGFLLMDVATANWAVIAIQSRYIQMLRGIPIEDEVNKVVPVHVNMATVAARFLGSQYLDAKLERPIKQRVGNQDNQISVFSFFKTLDDHQLAIGTLTDAGFKVLCTNVLNRPDLFELYPTNQMRVKVNDLIHIEIQKIISTQSKEYWIEQLQRAGIPYSEVSTVAEAVKKPYAYHFFSETTQGTLTIARPDERKPKLDDAPTLNQHGEALKKFLEHQQPESRYDYGQGRLHFLPVPRQKKQHEGPSALNNQDWRRKSI